MDFSFNNEFAIKYGVNEAIFCQNLYFWIRKNRANRKHFYDGHYWTYNSVSAYTELFEFWTKRQIETVISNCFKKGLIIKGNYNDTPYDRTAWYALTPLALEIYDFANRGNGDNNNEENPNPKNEDSIPQNCKMEESDMKNGNTENESPIPYNKPDNKQDNKTDINNRVELKGFNLIAFNKLEELNLCEQDRLDIIKFISSKNFKSILGDKKITVSDIENLIKKVLERKQEIRNLVAYFISGLKEVAESKQKIKITEPTETNDKSPVFYDWLS